MINYLLEVTIFWTASYLLYLLLFSRETFFAINRGYLLSTLVLGLIFPIIEWPSIVTHSPDPGIWQQYMEAVVVSAQQLEFTLEEVVVMSASVDEYHWSWLDVAKIIYLSGVVFFLIQFSLSIKKIIRIRSRAIVKNYATYSIVKTDQIQSPFSFFNTIFWNIHQDTETEESKILIRHELAHVRMRHSLDLVLLEVLKIIFWFHPLIYLFKKSIWVVHEYQADHAVLQRIQKKTYGQLLLQFAMPGISPSLTNHFNHSQLKKRIIMMTKNNSPRRALLKYGLIVPLFLMLGAVFLSADLRTDLNLATPEILSAQDTIKPKMIDNEEVFQVVEDMPRFKGCEDLAKAERKNCAMTNMLKFIYSNIKYPAAARDADIEGTVVIRFIVTKEGEIANAEITRDVGGGCGAEALRVVNSMPDWIPGMQGGKKVNTYFNLPVKYKLTGEKKSDKAKGNARVFVDGEEVPFEKLSKIDPDDIKSIQVWKGEKAIEKYGQNTANGVIELTLKHPKNNGKTDAIEDEIYQVVELMPRFPGCENQQLESRELKSCAQQKMLEFIYKNIRYPKEARNNGVEGTAVVRFVVDKNGRVVDPAIVRNIGSGTGEEVLRVVNMMSDMEESWVPGMQRGKSVNVYFNLPVKFKLDDETKKKLKLEKIETLALEHFKLFPNPAREFVFINFELKKEEEAGHLKVRMLDASGKELYFDEQGSFMGNYQKQIDVSSFARGPVFLQVMHDDRIFQEKFILL